MASQKARWLMVDDHGLLGTEQNSVPIYVTVPDMATILHSLAIVLGVYHAVLDSENAFFFFFSISLAPELHGGTTMGLLIVSPRLCAQPYNMSWDSNLRSASVLLPPISNTGLLYP